MENKLIEESMKKARSYRYNMEFRLKPDRQSSLIDILQILTQKNLSDIAETMEISADKLASVRRRQDFLTKAEAERLIQTFMMVCLN